MKTRTFCFMRAVLPGVAAALALLVVGCTYDAPLVTKHSIAIDPAVLGIWQAADEENDGEPARMVVLPFSKTEYLIHYPTASDDSMYFRGYAIKVAGVTCVQLELLGSHKGRETGNTRFLVAIYQLTGDRLEIRTLNEKVVSSELSGSDALLASFKKHAADPNLFNEPGTFTRIAH